MVRPEVPSVDTMQFVSHADSVRPTMRDELVCHAQATMLLLPDAATAVLRVGPLRLLLACAAAAAAAAVTSVCDAPGCVLD
eukprot:SAG25_NODE_2753_length_1403_cov_1.120399_2_plen_80_part_01